MPRTSRMISVICVICCFFFYIGFDGFLVSFIRWLPFNLCNPCNLLTLVGPMPHMPFVASSAPIHRHALCFELRILIKIFPSIILRLVSLLRLPGVMLACVVLRVRLERRHFVEVFVFVVAHVFSLCYLLFFTKVEFQL